MKPDKKAVGLRIREIRKKIGYSMEEFGKHVSDSPRSSVNSWEKGVSLPRKDKLERIALLGNTTVQQVLYGDFESYAHELIHTKLQMNVPKELEPTMIEVVKEAGADIGDDLEILKIMNHLIENMNPANENDYLEYMVFNDVENLFIAYGDRRETAIAFVHADREKQVFHFSPCPFSNMSLSRLYIFLVNSDLHHYIFNELRDFDFVECPTMVIYDIERTENKLRVTHFEYDRKTNNYQPVLDIGKIEQIGVYLPFINELSKEKQYRDSLE